MAFAGNKGEWRSGETARLEHWNWSEWSIVGRARDIQDKAITGYYEEFGGHLIMSV